MSTPAALPSIFGRFTAILKEHDHLGKTLVELRKMCDVVEAGQACSPELAPARLLEELRTDLSAHFSAEESPNYFGTVIEELPSLAPDVAALKWEHLAMLASVNRLLDLTSVPVQRRELCEGTRELIAQLEQHERAESVVLRRLFTTRSDQ